MADEQYDADGDVSRFLYEPTIEAPMATVLEALTVPVEPHPVPAIQPGETHQVPAVRSHVHLATHLQPHPALAIQAQPRQVPTVHSQTHDQAPLTRHVQPHPVPVPAIRAHPLQVPNVRTHAHQAPATMHPQPHPVSLPAIRSQPRQEAPATMHHPMPAMQVQHLHQVPTVRSQAHRSPPSFHVPPHPAPAIQAHHHQVPTNQQVHQALPTLQLQPHVHPVPAIQGFQASSLHVQEQQTPALSPAYAMHDHMGLPGAAVSEDLYAGFPISNSPSLYDEFMQEGEYDLAARLRSIEEDNQDGTGDGERGLDVDPVEDDVVFRAGQPQCVNCHVVREVKHQSESRVLHFIVHSASPGTFEHAIITKHASADGQIPSADVQHVDLRKRTHEWVRNFISKSLETLRNDTSGQLHDSCSSYCEAVSTNISAPVVNDPYMELEVNMLKKILSTHPASAEGTTQPVVQPTMQDDDDILEEINEAYDDDNCAELLPQILESSHVPKPGSGGQGASVSATAYPSMLARQTQRVAKMSMQDTLEYLHKSKEDAERELSDYATFKQQCRKNHHFKWAAQQINKLNKKIMKLEQTGQRVGETGLLKIKHKLDIIMVEKRRLYGDIKKCLQKDRNNTVEGPSGSKNDVGDSSSHKDDDPPASGGNNAGEGSGH